MVLDQGHRLSHVRPGQHHLGELVQLLEAVVAPDFGRTVARLREAGFDPRPGTDAWDAPRSFVRDPAGNLVEVMSAVPEPPWPEE